MKKRLKAARPYVKAIATDEKAREHAVRAAGQAVALQQQLRGLGPEELVFRLIDDRETKDTLRELSREAGKVRRRAMRRKNKWLIALVAAGSLTLVLTRKPVRAKLSETADRLRRSQDGDDPEMKVSSAEMIEKQGDKSDDWHEDAEAASAARSE